MNYDDPTLRDHLAAEYALGTLRGAARRRFERLMRDDPALRALVGAWDARLNPLAESAPPVPPPETVWTRIEARLGPEAAPAVPRPPARARRRSLAEILFGRPQGSVPSLATAGLWYCVGFWRTAGITGVALVTILAIYLVAGRPTEDWAPTHVAVLSAAEGAAVMVARVDTRTGRLALTPVALPPTSPDRAFELWLLPPGGAAPRSLGLVGAGRFERTGLPAEDIAGLVAGGLAISLEPAGGSPSGQPTGPVLFSGAVLPAS